MSLPALTPGREIEIEIDGSTIAQIEPFFSKRKIRFEIRDAILTNTEQLATGVHILKPIATSLATLHETSAGQATIVPLTSFNHPNIVQTLPLQRAFTDLPGVTPSVVVSPTGDNFYIKRLPAASSWNVQLIETRPVPPLPTPPNYPLDTMLQLNTGLDPYDQGYVVRWIEPAHPMQHLDYVLSLVFGGELTPSGYGLFELVFGGDGRAFLFEWIEAAWQKVDEWRYATAEVVPGMGHVCRIIPHCGKYLEIRTNITDRTQPGFLFQNRRLNAFSGQSVSQDAHVYEVKNRGSLPPLGGGVLFPVTGAGHPQFRVRQDLLLRWQLARITYPASGTIRDQPFTVPVVNTSTHPLEIDRHAMVSYDALTLAPRGSVSAVVYNALTGAALSPLSESYVLGGRTLPMNGFALPGAPNSVSVEITLTNLDGTGGTYSPWFLGYEARKRGENATTAGDRILINSNHNRTSPCTRLQIAGTDQDPSHEMASMRIADLSNRIPRLGVRGEGTIRITTTTGDPAHPDEKSVLFDGYWVKSESKLRGNLGRVYPSPDWRDYELSCLGRFKRLHERDYTDRALWSFAKDPDDTLPNDLKGRRPPWKVTDCIRQLLATVGVPDDMMDVPDLPLRLWFSGMQEWKDVIEIHAGANVFEFAQRLGQDYLNRFLIFDANAGLRGKWRLKAVPTTASSSVWTFHLGGVLPAGRLAHVMGAYGSNACTIHKDTLQEWTIPPEGNYVEVTGQAADSDDVIRLWARNTKSYNRPGEATADANHTDYVDGTFRPLYRRHDPALQTVAAVMFVLRRTFDIACRAQRYARFEAPLVLIDARATEPDQYPLYRFRPLMFGDTVTFRGAKWQVKQCRMGIRKAHNQKMILEIAKLNEPLPV